MYFYNRKIEISHILKRNFLFFEQKKQKPVLYAPTFKHYLKGV